MNPKVDEYASRLTGWQAEAFDDLRRSLLASRQLAESFKWAQPVYENGGPVCWIKAHKAHLTFGFWRGAALRSLDARIEGSGDKMGHIKLTRVGELSADNLARLVGEAVRLNGELGDPTRG